MRNEIVMIGPCRAGKSTLARLLAAQLGLPHAPLDPVAWGYYEEIGFEWDCANRIREAEGALAFCRYVWPFLPHAVERHLAQHEGCVFDLGGGHTVPAPWLDEAVFDPVQQALAPFRNVVLVLPSPDLDRSAAVLRERSEEEWRLQEIWERHGFDMNEHFVRHPANERLAKLTVYTEGKTPEETRDEILERVQGLTPG
jgi:hypothetical protein